MVVLFWFTVSASAHTDINLLHSVVGVEIQIMCLLSDTKYIDITSFIYVCFLLQTVEQNR